MMLRTLRRHKIITINNKMWYIGVLCAILLGLLGVLAWVSFRPRNTNTPQVSLAEHTHHLPRIIHQVWVGNKPVPEFYTKCQKTWKIFNTEYEHKMHTDKTAIDFVREHYPQYLSVYQDMAKPVERADMLRYLVVHHYGGVYADMDTSCLMPIDKLFTPEDKVVVAIEFEKPSGTQILQWAFAARPKQQVFLDIADEIVVRHNYLSSRKSSMPWVDIDTLTLWKTGPMLFTEYMMKHYKKDPKSITIHEKCTFGAYDMTPMCLKKAYLVHHFDGSWKKHWNEHLRKFKNIHS